MYRRTNGKTLFAENTKAIAPAEYFYECDGFEYVL